MADKIAVVKFDGHWPNDLSPKYSLADVCTDEQITQYLSVFSSYVHVESDETEE